VQVAVGAPFVSWVALGWGEPCVPWWGRPGFVGHAWWGGWGGPRVVNNVVIQRNTFVNVKNITVYRNAGVRNAVIGVNRDRFGQGRAEHVRLDAQKLQPVHGEIGVRPTAASLTPREGHAARPPAAMRERRVVATRAPENVNRRLEAAGLKAGRSQSPEPRVMSTSRGRTGRRAEQGPSGGGGTPYNAGGSNAGRHERSVQHGGGRQNTRTPHPQHVERSTTGNEPRPHPTPHRREETNRGNNDVRTPTVHHGTSAQPQSPVSPAQPRVTRPSPGGRHPQPSSHPAHHGQHERQQQ